MRGFTSAKRRHFIPIIDSLPVSTKTRPRDRSNRLLEDPFMRDAWRLTKSSKGRTSKGEPLQIPSAGRLYKLVIG